MRVFERLGRMIRSDVHGVIDQLEERTLLMKQHLRDAEIELVRKRACAQELDEEQRRLREQIDRLEGRERSLDEDVELALDGDRDELARFAVRKLLTVKEARSEARARSTELGARRDRLAERLEEQEFEFEELQQRVEARIAELREKRTAAPTFARPVADEEIDIELLRRSRAKRASVGEVL